MTEKELLERALSYIVDGLKHVNLRLANRAGDGRLDSATNEDDIVAVIQSIAEHNSFFRSNGLRIGTPNLESTNNREWYDFSIESAKTDVHNYFMPVNIKITHVNAKNADNLSCKLGIFYALTGKLPKQVSIGQGVSWESFFKAMDDAMAYRTDKDYYFLVIDKDNTKDVFWNSLKRLHSLTPNGNNLPFQCKWCENRIWVERDYYTARDFILQTLEVSINRRETIGAAFKKYLKKYIGMHKENVLESGANDYAP